MTPAYGFGVANAIATTRPGAQTPGFVASRRKI
jgi:hypothetical protein